MFASEAISIMALLPSTKLVSIFGFICFCAARSASVSGLASGSSGLFLPFPAQMTSKFRSRA